MSATVPPIEPSSQKLNWVPRVKDIAAPPPSDPQPQIDGLLWAEFGVLDPDPSRQPGTVPSLQPPSGVPTLVAQGLHSYGKTYQLVSCYGGEGILSVHDPSVSQSGGYSLGQIAVVNLGNAPGSPVVSTSNQQTVEAGWHTWEARYGDTAPHLFVFFTTNGYSTQFQDLTGCYNSDFQGWVQYSDTIYPGVGLSYSKDTNDPSKYQAIRIKFQLYDGNWWLSCNGNWIGYYPTSLFTKVHPGGLDTSANVIAFYGEVAAQQPAQNSPDVGPQSMGKGSPLRTPSDWATAAFMRNLKYQMDINGTLQDYIGARSHALSDFPFDVETFYGQVGAFGNYIRYGGKRTWWSRLVTYVWNGRPVEALRRLLKRGKPVNPAIWIS